MSGGSEHTRQLRANARLVTIAAIVLGDQPPERTIQLVEAGIRCVEDILNMIEEPFSQVLKRSLIAQIRGDQALELVRERRHGSSL